MKQQVCKNHLSTAETADLIGISATSLNRLRRRGDGPPAVRINSRVYRFRRSDVDQWLRLVTQKGIGNERDELTDGR
jgi:predicted DNA-binding transcriptional regulator AlpA